MSILRNDSLQVAAPKNVDSRYDNDGLGYISVSAVNSAIGQSFRFIGLTVNIQGIEYWYESGTSDVDLVLKSTGSGLLNVSDGSGNNVNIGTTLNGGGSTLSLLSSDANADIIISPKGTGTIKATSSHTANIGEENDLITFSYAEANYGVDVSGLTAAADNETITGNWTFSNDVTISGNLTVVGTTVQIDSQIETGGTIIVLNDGEVGSGVTAGYSGLRVDRGSATNDFWFGFDEVRDAFTVGLVNQTLTAGEIAGTDIVALREDSPLSDGIAKWDSVNKRLVFVDQSTISGINYGNSGEVAFTDGSQLLYNSGFVFNGSSLLAPQINVDNINLNGNTISSTSGDIALSSSNDIINFEANSGDSRMNIATSGFSQVLTVGSSNLSDMASGSPYIKGSGSGTGIASFFFGDIDADSGLNPAIVIGGQLTSSLDINNRPILSIRNRLTDLSTWNPDGSIIFNSYGSGTVSGVATTAAAFDSTGKIIETSLNSSSGAQYVLDVSDGSGGFQSTNWSIDVNGDLINSNSDNIGNSVSYPNTIYTGGIISGDNRLDIQNSLGAIDLNAQGSDIVISSSGVEIQGIIYPSVDGSANQVLTTNGSGSLYWSTVSGSGATQLSELTDVVSASNINGFALIANGTTGYVGRAITEADISDLGTYLSNIVEDTTPELSGDLAVNGFDLLNVGNIQDVSSITNPSGISLNTVFAPVTISNGLDMTSSEITNVTTINGVALTTGGSATNFLNEQGNYVSAGGATQLSDLTDVNTSTPTNRNVLVADGVDWESRPLTILDISDYSAFSNYGSNDQIPYMSGGVFNYSDNFRYFTASSTIYTRNTNSNSSAAIQTANNASSNARLSTFGSTFSGLDYFNLPLAGNSVLSSSGNLFLGADNIFLGTIVGFNDPAITISQSNSVIIHSAYSLPNSDGTSGQFLTTDGAGTVSFATISGSSVSVSSSGNLSSTNVQDALLELQADIDGLGAGSADGYISNVVLSGNSLDFTGVLGGFNGSVDLSSLSGSTLTEEEVQDFAWNVLSGTQTLITVAYDDVNNNVDFIVDNNLANYDNSTSAFITVSALSGYVQTTDIDTFAELQAIVADATLVQAGDNVSIFTNDVGYLTSEVNDLSAAVTWVNIPDANVPESAVTQHQAALTINQSQIVQNIQTVSSTNPGTVTPTTDNDVVEITDLQNAVTIANPTGTPANYDSSFLLTIDANGAYAITWGGSYTGNGFSLPTTTVSDRTMIFSIFYSSDLSQWVVSTGNSLTLSDLTDVTSAATTSGFALIADGSSYIGRAITTSDISNLSSYTGFDARYYTETEVDALTWDASDIVSGTFADARIAQSNVTQHQAALSITESQISDFGTYETADADILKADVTDQLTVGYSASVYNAGTQTTGTLTPNEANGNKQRVINGGAFTLAPPTNFTNIELLVTNNASAGAITTTGFTQVVGDSFDTTNTNQFLCNISTTTDGSSTISVLNVIALQ